jgi:glycosyltransferase involved in cell wall biosynthesis
VRIAIDGRELSGETTGVGRYLQHLLLEWARLSEANAHRFSIYSPDGRIGLPPDFPGEVVLAPGAGGTRWEQGRLAALLRKDRPDVLFAPGYTAPIVHHIPTVLVIHDVSFLAHPEWFGRREGLRRRVVVRLSASRARRILTVSQFSRDEIIRRLGISATRVRVIHHGLPAPRAAVTVTREPLVLYVGSLFNRRHIPELIDGFARVAAANPAVRLMLVGRNRTHPRQEPEALARDAGVGDRVVVRDWIDDVALAEAYGRASAFAFLSEYEGFGFTPLEALAAGVPPVVLDTPVAREVYGDASIRIATPNPDAIAGALTEALAQEGDVRRAVLAAAPAVLARYSWTATARQTLAAIEEAARA